MNIQETIQKIIDLCEDKGLMATYITKEGVCGTVLSTPDQEIARRLCDGKQIPNEWKFEDMMDHTDYFTEHIKPLSDALYQHCAETRTPLAGEICYKVGETTHGCDLSIANGNAFEGMTRLAIGVLYKGANEFQKELFLYNLLYAKSE